jgi:hypothetical protein
MFLKKNIIIIIIIIIIILSYLISYIYIKVEFSLGESLKSVHVT